jgi:microcystin-dependent protein
MDYYLGQIGIFGFNFAPINWALCVGTILPIQQNSALFSLLGTYYGGNGQTTFGLPDLRSRTPYGMGSQTPIGVMGGMENVTLLVTQMPSHNHLMQVDNTGLADVTTLKDNFFAIAKAAGAATKGYAPTPQNVTLASQTISNVGGSQPHTNIQPYETVNFCIATSGIFPPRT